MPIPPTRQALPSRRLGAEEPYNGSRMLAYRHGLHVRLDHPSVDHTERFADLTAAVATRPARSLILDAEVCAFDETLVSTMQLLMPPIRRCRHVDEVQRVRLRVRADRICADRRDGTVER